MTSIRKAIAGALAGTIALASGIALAASDYVGKWKTTDTTGKAFEITLGADGTAKATQGDGLTGTWKEAGGAAVITWSSGWTTKIAKDGAGYKKTAYDKGKPVDGAPTNSAAAEKVK